MGYAGGRQVNPTYRHIGDHTETVQVDYDPKRITYGQLLDIFWKSHTPTSGSRSGQYMRAVFYHDENQRKQAEAARTALEQELGHTVHTRVVPLRSFTMAEDYHQKYLLKQQHRLMVEMARIYPSHRDFVDSTAVARINGYVGGNGSREPFERAIDRLGLSDAGKQTLQNIVQRQWDYERQ